MRVEYILVHMDIDSKSKWSVVNSIRKYSQDFLFQFLFFFAFYFNVNVKHIEFSRHLLSAYFETEDTVTRR